MLFNSIQFAIFLPLVFVIYWLLRKNLRLQNLFVVVASYVFYGWWDWRFLILIVLTSALSWASGLLISSEKGKSVEVRDKNYAKWYLIGNITINLLILGIFKYFNFFVDSFCSIFHLSSCITLNVILPVGISFYTFQALSYSIDVFRGNIKATRDVVAFFAYVSFFPQLVAGPIERATNLLPQFEKPREFDYADAVDGCRRILWGLFKKMVIADNCAIYVDSVWKDYADQNASTLVLAAILFAFQIYGDFSGYSDIAIGTAKLFGINLKDNFLSPYFSRNVAEFWKRWHISLNTWFVDYVYIPLGGSREGKWKTICNTFAIFLLSGLWHGANWTYVGWGAYHALLFVPLILLGTTKKYRDTASWRQLPQMLLTFALVVLGWIIFRAPSISDAWQYITMICDKSILSAPWLINRAFYLPTLLGVIVMLTVEWHNREYAHGLARVPNNKYLRYGMYFVITMVCCLYMYLHIEADSQFIYFQF